MHPRMTVPTSRPYIIMDYMQYGSLDRYPTLPDAGQVARTFRQLFEAVAYLHAKGITHRDIKPANVLVKSLDPFEVVLADFDFAIWDLPLARVCGTSAYVAPEIMTLVTAARKDGDSYTSKVDVWSLGVMLLDYCALDATRRSPGCKFSQLAIVASKPVKFPQRSSKTWPRAFNGFGKAHANSRPKWQA